ncbi:MAG: hypothetical protein ACLUPW_10820 [Bifidobacterium pseudocatenulatum]
MKTHLNGFQDGVWTPPEYHETAKTWLTESRRGAGSGARGRRYSAAIPP